MTKIPIEALKLAISRGYQSGIADIALLFLEDKTLEENIRWQVVALDREFWEKLGRGLGNKDEMRCDSPKCDTVRCEYVGYKDPRRMYDQFCDLVWRGQDPTEYWNALLANK